MKKTLLSKTCHKTLTQRVNDENWPILFEPICFGSSVQFRKEDYKHKPKSVSKSFWSFCTNGLYFLASNMTILLRIVILAQIAYPYLFLAFQGEPYPFLTPQSVLLIP